MQLAVKIVMLLIYTRIQVLQMCTIPALLCFCISDYPIIFSISQSVKPNRTTSPYFDHTEKKTHAVWTPDQNG